MSSLPRITAPLLDVLFHLRQAYGTSEGLYGWQIAKAAKRSGPTVYDVLDILEDHGWLAGHWENGNPEIKKPRHRFYRLTEAGLVGANTLFAEHRSKRLKSVAPDSAGPRARRPLPGSAG